MIVKHEKYVIFNHRDLLSHKHYMHIVNKRIKTVGNNGELLFIPHRNFAKVFDTRKTRVIGLQSSEEIMTIS